MSDVTPDSHDDYLKRQRAREKALHWENRAHEAEAEVERLRNAARAVIETSDAPTMTAEHEAILQLRAALDA